MIGSGLMKGEGRGSLARLARTRRRPAKRWKNTGGSRQRGKKQISVYPSPFFFLFLFYDRALIQPFVICGVLKQTFSPLLLQDEERFQLEGISINTPTHTGIHTHTLRQTQAGAGPQG